MEIENNFEIPTVYSYVLEQMKLNQTQFFENLKENRIDLGNDFGIDIFKTKWNMWNEPTNPHILEFCQFIISQTSLRCKFNNEETMNVFFRDAVYMFIKMYNEGPSKEEAVQLFYFFTVMYEEQIFTEYENPDNNKKFRFIDSIVDCLIQYNLIAVIPTFYQLGYEPKMELYLYSMSRHSNDLLRLQKLYDIGTPLNKVLCEYSARMGSLQFVDFFHKKGCEWDSLTLFGACQSLNKELIEYCFKENCQWNPEILYIYNIFFSPENLIKPELNHKRELIKEILTLIKSYTKPIEIDFKNNDDKTETNEPNENP